MLRKVFPDTGVLTPIEYIHLEHHHYLDRWLKILALLVCERLE